MRIWQSRPRRTGVGSEVADEDLIRRVVQGEVEAYEGIVRRYQDRLYRYALGMVLDSDVAADLVQDSLVKAYSTLRTCRDPSRFDRWVFRILRNRCLDYLKERRRKDVPLECHHEGGHASVGPEPDLDRRVLRDAIDRALTRLPDAQREAFLLKHVQDLSYEEMAEVTGASVSALRMRVLRARELLQAELSPVGAAAVETM
jgi:RNA polymerase sigma-70 factor, ECF subfamily